MSRGISSHEAAVIDSGFEGITKPMAKFFPKTGPNGIHLINLELVREASQDMDGNLMLRFDRDDEIKIEPPEAGNCMAALNELSVPAVRHR